MDDTLIWVRRDDSWNVVYKLERNQVGRGIKRVLQQSNNLYLLLDFYSNELHVYNTKIKERSELVSFKDDSYIYFSC